METFKLNEVIVRTLNHWSGQSLYTTNLVVFCAVYLGWLMIFILFLYVYQSKRHWTTFRFILMSLVVALSTLALADLIKHFYPVARPSFTMKDINPLFVPGDIGSFPSSHMSFFSGLAFALWWRKKKLGLWFLSGACLIGLARVAAGVHYPLDIVIGGLLGFIISWLFRRFLRAR